MSVDKIGILSVIACAMISLSFGSLCSATVGRFAKVLRCDVVVGLISKPSSF